MKYVGLDLAASEKRPTGVAILEVNDGKYTVITLTLFDDEELLSIVNAQNPRWVVIDAPLSDAEGPWRQEERLLLQAGYRPLPLTLPSMKMLTQRAIKVKKVLGDKAVETFAPALRSKIHHIHGKNEHERDAVMCAVVGYLLDLGKVLRFGSIVLPACSVKLEEGKIYFSSK